jgi:predicted ATP-binding protein involved in virulence
MRITHISVKALFGIFNHEIELNSEERITIIHGPNGLGKTVLLSMINSLFSGRYSFYRTIPFTEFGIRFDDGRTLSLKKNPKSDFTQLPPNKRPDDLTLELQKNGSRAESYQIRPLHEIRIQFPLEMVAHVVPGMERIAQTTWFYTVSQETLSIEDVIERFGDRLPTLPGRHKEPQPEWLTEIKNNVSIRFIETQRLLAYARATRVREYDGRSPMIPAVRNYSEELASLIQSKLAEYATLSQSLDRSFPTRLVKGGGSPHSTIDELRTELNALEEKRARLEVAGLLDKEQIDFQEFPNIDENNSYVLSVYIHDVKKKLGVFDELTNKIDLLVKIVNNRFLYKEMSISKKDGFVFKASNGKHVPTASLSSGEQHELVLFYELLFKVKPNSLILIDEPELSLHVVWQQQFLSDLEDITQLTGFDILIATHSPQIIHDRWDLTVELKGPQNAQLPDGERHS